VLLAHQAILVLAAKGEGFGSSGVITVPGLSGRLQKFVPEAAVLEGFLASLHVSLVHPTSSIKPWDIGGRGNSHSRRAVLPRGRERPIIAETSAHGFPSIRAGRRRHADHIGQTRRLWWDVVVVVTVSAAFAVVALTRLAGCGAEGREGFVILEVGLTRRGGARGVSTPWP